MCYNELKSKGGINMSAINTILLIIALLIGLSIVGKIIRAIARNLLLEMLVKKGDFDHINSLYVRGIFNYGHLLKANYPVEEIEKLDRIRKTVFNIMDNSK